MRSAQKSNRSRGRGNRKGNGNNVNRVYESTGPEGKVRGTPQQIYDKYITLARDAQTSGDRVTAENFLQHAEHYQRILSQAAAAQNERREAANGDARGDEDGERAQDQAENDVATTEQNDRSEPDSSAQVGGMTTIDADDSAPAELLVATEEPGESQPQQRRRRGNGKSRPEVDLSGSAPSSDPAAE